MRGEEGAGAIKGSDAWYPELDGQSGDGEKCREVRGEFAAGRRLTSWGAVSHVTRPQLLSELVRVRRPRRWPFGQKLTWQESITVSSGPKPSEHQSGPEGDRPPAPPRGSSLGI